MPRTLTDDEVARFRDRLCDAAEKLFAAHGAEAVTLRQISGALGVSAMTPYRYFKDRDAILAAVRARAFDRHAEALERAFAAGGPGRAEAVGEAYVTFALENPEAYKLMFDVRQPSAESYPDLVRAMTRSRATMTAHLEDMARQGRFSGDADYVGHLFWAALHGALMLQLTGVLEGGMDVRRLTGGLMQTIERGLRA